MRGLRAAAFVLAALLAACGGGSGSSPPPLKPLPPPNGRDDLLLGYYFGRLDFVEEMADHANLLWISPEGGPAEQAAALRQARAAGVTRVVLMLPHENAARATPSAQERRAWLQEIDARGELTAAIVAVYWIDEPDTPRHRLEGPALAAHNALLRGVMAEFPALAATQIGVLYACGGDRPGIESFDWVGCNAYGEGCDVLGRAVETMRLGLLPGQRLLVVPGGSDPWRQDPGCFEAYANAHREVVAIVPFTWQTVTDEGVTYRGIRENGMSDAYRALGRRIRGR